MHYTPLMGVWAGGWAGWCVWVGGWIGPVGGRLAGVSGCLGGWVFWRFPGFRTSYGLD